MKPRKHFHEFNRNEFNESERDIAIRMLCALVKRELPNGSDQQTRTASTSSCPRCNGSSIAKRGKDDKGRQRYQCKACKTSFTSHTISPLASSHLPISTWRQFIECHVDLLSLRESAAKCQVTLKTAFRMRHRLLRIIDERVLEGALAAEANRNTHSAHCRSITCPDPLPSKAAGYGDSGRITAAQKDQAHISLIIHSRKDGSECLFVNRHACKSTQHAVIALAKACLSLLLPHMQKNLFRPTGKLSRIAEFVARFKRTTAHTRHRYRMWYRWIHFVKLTVLAHRFADLSIAKALQMHHEGISAIMLPIAPLIKLYESA